MRSFIICALLLSGCVNSPAPLILPLNTIIENKDAYDRKLVCTTGVLYIDIETRYLCSNENTKEEKCVSLGLKSNLKKLQKIFKNEIGTSVTACGEFLALNLDYKPVRYEGDKIIFQRGPYVHHIRKVRINSKSG